MPRSRAKLADTFHFCRELTGNIALLFGHPPPFSSAYPSLPFSRQQQFLEKLLGLFFFHCSKRDIAEFCYSSISKSETNRRTFLSKHFSLPGKSDIGNNSTLFSVCPLSGLIQAHKYERVKGGGAGERRHMSLGKLQG